MTPLKRINIPGLIMHIDAYSTDELEILADEYKRCILLLQERWADKRLLPAIRRRARATLKRVSRDKKRIERELASRTMLNDTGQG